MSTYTNVDWMTVDDHGATSGNGYVTHTCQGAYSGRVQRTGYTTITTVETSPKTATVEFIQLAKPEHVTFNSISYAATASGGTVTIQGTTNSPRLDFALTNDTDSIGSLPSTFSITVGGTTTGGQTVSGQTFANDPGASQEFSFTIVVTIAENETLNQRSCRIVGTGSTGVTGYADIIQAAGSSYIYLDEENVTSKSITFTAAGTSGGSSSVDVDILSNDDWEVNVHD